VVLLPLSALCALPVAQLEAILLHELAHVRRLDYLVNLLQLGVEALLFHHPATHWISRQIRIEREYCCDDEVVRLSGDPLSYARALERLEGLRQPTSLALAANEGALMSRIRRLLTPTPAPRGRRSLALIAALVATVAVLTLAVHHRAEAYDPGPVAGGMNPAAGAIASLYASWLGGAIRPVEGARVSLPFGQQQNPFSGLPYFHEGIDLANTPGTAVSAPLPGEVIFAEPDGDRGNVVVLRHGEGLESRYHHLGDIAVRPGQKLAKGERLGSIGVTGKTTGPHVHVELREHGVAIDPRPIVD
jgi:murein DD-endopeptidase MepM/ murein hydrolase activator NlpD